MRETVTAPDDELLEGVLGVEVAFGSSRPRCRKGSVAVRGRPVRADDADAGVGLVAGGGGPSQERQVALFGPGPDVLRRPDEQGVPPYCGELQRLEPDMELEVGGLPAEL